MESFTSVKELGTAEERICADPECGGTAEPDQDGDHRFWSCNDCGYDFGYEKIETNLLAEGADGSCSVGIPESVRRQASSGMEAAMAKEAQAQPVDLGLSIGKRPGLT